MTSHRARPLPLRLVNPEGNLAGAHVTQPSLFIGGTRDNTSDLPELERLPGCAGVKVSHTDIASGATNPKAIYVRSYIADDAPFGDVAVGARGGEPLFGLHGQDGGRSRASARALPGGF